MCVTDAIALVAVHQLVPSSPSLPSLLPLPVIQSPKMLSWGLMSDYLGSLKWELWRHSASVGLVSSLGYHSCQMVNGWHMSWLLMDPSERAVEWWSRVWPSESVWPVNIVASMLICWVIVGIILNVNGLNAETKRYEYAGHMKTCAYIHFHLSHHSS